MWNMYLLQLLPRSSSELQPVLMNSVRVRSATWPIVRPEADEISPMMQATLSRSIMRSALVEAVCGLTESSFSNSILRPLTPPAALISVHRHVGCLHRELPERAEEAGARRQVSDADDVRLRAREHRNAEGRNGRGAGQQCAAAAVDGLDHWVSFV